MTPFKKLTLAAFLLGLGLPLAADTITVELEPAAGTFIAGDGITVRAVHIDPSGTRRPVTDALITVETRPAGRFAELRDVGRLSSQGELTLYPDHAGLVRIHVLDPSSRQELAQTDLAVLHPELPIPALLVLLGAGGLLFGGAGVCFRRQMG